MVIPFALSKTWENSTLYKNSAIKQKSLPLTGKYFFQIVTRPSQFLLGDQFRVMLKPQSLLCLYIVQNFFYTNHHFPPLYPVPRQACTPPYKYAYCQEGYYIRQIFISNPLSQKSCFTVYLANSRPEQNHLSDS
jgi:hypothetical protein